MNIFTRKLSQADEPELPVDPIKLYETCPYADGYAYLRGIQEEVLRAWHQRRSERDIICKMNTGSGKTLTGLLMLYSKLIENKEPCLYVCPDRQLMEQTILLAAYYGIPICTFAEDPKRFPADFINCKKILVCTFQKLFNGKSIFTRDQLKLGAIILDDAHKCVDIARNQSSLRLNRDHPIAEKLFKLFEAELTRQAPGSFHRLAGGDPHAMQKVPYWIWMDNNEKVIEVINNYILNREGGSNQDDDAIDFKWNFMSDNLLAYDCYMGGNSIEINPIHVPYYEVPSFHEARHRYILSATFEDDYDLIKDLGIKLESILNPIVPEDRKDIGKRLILAPSRFDHTLTDDRLQQFISEYPKQGYNVVVLVSSTNNTTKWVNQGATYVDKDNIEEALENLRDPQKTGHFMVFNNRYDGIDLHGEMCRVLVIDGLPLYSSLQEQYYESRLDSLRSGKKAQIIEQGLGRGVRSGGDYCVVYLMGHDLVNFLGFEKSLQHFTPVTKAQLNLGLKLLDNEGSTDSLRVIKETASYCLDQHPDWIKFHNQELKNISTDRIDDRKEHLLKLADRERLALLEFRNRKYESAAEIILSNAIGNRMISDKEKAWYLQFAAQLMYLGNRVQSNDLQSKAADLTTRMFHPKDGHSYKKILKKGMQASIIKEKLSRFERPQDIVIHVNGILSDLQYSPEIDAKKFETKLSEVGKFLGFNTQMPERETGNGPDVLWCLTDSHYLILEAKSRATHGIISRDNVEQLLHSEEWFKQRYGADIAYTTVTLQNSNKKGDNVNINEYMKVLDKDALNLLRENLLGFAQALQSTHTKAHSEENISRLLDAYRFTSPLFKATYLKSIKN